MVNLILLIIGTTVYGDIFYYVHKRKAAKNSEQHFDKEKAAWKSYLIALVLCIPFNWEGNIITVLGNVKSDKDIFSVVSFYQNTKGNAHSFIQMGYQKGYESRSIISMLSFQKSDNYSFALLGLLNIQESIDNTTTGLGIPAYQKANNCYNNCGLTIFMKEHNEKEYFVLLRQD